MPSRWMCFAILGLWLFATASLVRREVLPRWVVGPAPSLKSLAKGLELPAPSRWAILALDAKGGELKVGQIDSEAARDGEWVTLTSRVALQAGAILQGTPLRVDADVELAIHSETKLDSSGELASMKATVSEAEGGHVWMTLTADRRGGRIELAADGAEGAIRFRESFPYTSSGQLQQTFGPVENLRGLVVGQSWESRVVNPLAPGAPAKARVEVRARKVIRWQGKLVETLEVVTEMKPFQARTWVRPTDGVILRQEVPIPFVKLILERRGEVPDPFAQPQATPTPP
jgi:hypothetical protein